MAPGFRGLHPWRPIAFGPVVKQRPMAEAQGGGGCSPRSIPKLRERGGAARADGPSRRTPSPKGSSTFRWHHTLKAMWDSGDLGDSHDANDSSEKNRKDLEVKQISQALYSAHQSGVVSSLFDLSLL